MKKLGELIEKADIIRAAADMDIEVHGISFDTRTLRPGELFVAVIGYERDGHRYIEEATKKGAVCVLCQEAPASEAAPYVLMKDTRKALACVSASWFDYPADKLKTVGITGTNGKTTVTSLLKQVVEKYSGAKAGLIGTNVNIIGDREVSAKHTTPESYEIQELLYEMAAEGCEYAVMEVSSHALHLDRVHGIEFDVGVFTNLSPDHLDFHDTMEDYAKTKARLFSNCGSAAVNIDDSYAQTMIGNADCGVLKYAINDCSADLLAGNIKLHADRAEFCATTDGKAYDTQLRIPGMFSVYNALAVISSAILLGFDAGRAAAILRSCDGVRGRAEIVPIEKDFTVMIDYAHTPDALENVIKAARDFTQGRVITLFGCGGDRDSKKRPIMGKIAACLSDYVIVTSDNPRTEKPGAIIEEIIAGMEDTKTPYRVIENRREAIHWALGSAEAGDVLILAGKGHETYQIFGKEKRHFDEREVVAEFFGERKN